MFKSNLKIAFRNLIKYKQYSLINILGLAVFIGRIFSINDCITRC